MADSHQLINFVLLSTQMVRLHRDPQGENVFMPPQLAVVDDVDVEILRTRVTELEKMLTDQKNITSVSDFLCKTTSNLYWYELIVVHIHCFRLTAVKSLPQVVPMQTL